MTAPCPHAELLAQLAQAAPKRFVWFPDHEALRVSLALEGHDTASPCTDAFLQYNPAHEAFVIWGIWLECQRLGWEWSLCRMEETGPLRHQALVYLEPDDDGARAFDDDHSPLAALGQAFLSAVRRKYGEYGTAP